MWKDHSAEWVSGPFQRDLPFFCQLKFGVTITPSIRSQLPRWSWLISYFVALRRKYVRWRRHFLTARALPSQRQGCRDFAGGALVM